MNNVLSVRVRVRVEIVALFARCAEIIIERKTCVFACTDRIVIIVFIAQGL